MPEYAQLVEWKEIAKIEKSRNEEGEVVSGRGSEPYLYDMDEHGLPVFSDKNIALVDCMNINNSQYNQADEEKDKEIFKGIVNEDGSKEWGLSRLQCIGFAVREIDRANSTRLSSVGTAKGITGKVDALLKESGEASLTIETGEEKSKDGNTITGGLLITAKAIAAIDASKLEEQLYEGDYELVRDIAHAVETYVSRESGSKIETKKNNFSFATKFCHWACIYIFGKDHDEFCIYDNVVKNVLPYYLSVYDVSELNEYIKYNRKGIPELNDSEIRADYKKYKRLYDSLVAGIKKWREENGLDREISYGEIDQLIWYYFKGASGAHAKRALDVVSKKRGE